jgi:hypothetical protein
MEKEEENTSTFKEKSNTFLWWAQVCILMAGLLGAIGVFGYQIIIWLRSGEWTSLPFGVIFLYFEPDWFMATDGWLNNPQDWKGIHKIIEFILLKLPLSIGLFISGILSSWIIAVNRDDF